MRVLLVVATVLVLLAGLQLFVFAERTDEWFAWTISPTLTAAFLGAAYWGSAAVQWTASRASAWADARVSVPGVFVFTLLTLVVTGVHLDRFHLAGEESVATRAVTWAWIAVYSAVPILMAVLWWRQSRLPGADPPREHPLPRPLLAVVLVIAVLLLAMGSWLLIAPAAAAQAWPWPLTPLTGRAIGAWLVGLGVSAAQTVVEADAVRVRPVAWGAVALPVLVVVALARYGSAVAWGSASAVALVGCLAVWFVIGVVLVMLARRQPTSVR
jgi:hypothetical protein